MTDELDELFDDFEEDREYVTLVFAEPRHPASAAVIHLQVQEHPPSVQGLLRTIPLNRAAVRHPLEWLCHRPDLPLHLPGGILTKLSDSKDVQLTCEDTGIVYWYYLNAAIAMPTLEYIHRIYSVQRA